MITDQQIADAKLTTKYTCLDDITHGHNDRIRQAYEFLDAQTRIKTPSRKYHHLKHIIEDWSGIYISRNDVEVAATLHPDIRGSYPYYNLPVRLCVPSVKPIN